MLKLAIVSVTEDVRHVIRSVTTNILNRLIVEIKY